MGRVTSKTVSNNLCFSLLEWAIVRVTNGAAAA